MTKTMAKIFSFGLLVLGLMMVDIKGPTFETKTYDSYTVSSMNWESWSVGINQADAWPCFSCAWDAVTDFASDAWDTVTDVAGTVYAKGTELVRDTLNTAGAIVTLGYVDNLGDITTSAITQLNGLVIDGVDWVLGNNDILSSDWLAQQHAKYAGIDGWENATMEYGFTTAPICVTLKNGEKVCTTTGMTGTGVMQDCMPLPLKLDQMATCIFCPLFEVLYNASEAMATVSYKTLADAFKVLLAIGLALYLAFITLKQVSAFTKQDAPKYISEALTISFKVLLAWLILSKGEELYRLVLQPLLSAGLEFGASFLTHQDIGTATVDVKSCVSDKTLPAAEGVVFYSRELYTKIDCFLKAVAQEIAVSQAIGGSLMCVANNAAAGMFNFPDLDMMFSGLLMWIFSWVICLAFGFYLIDCVIRLGIVGAIMPFLIASWPFKITQKYSTEGWKMFLNAFFTFVFIGLVVSVNIELMARAATGGTGSTDAIFELFNGDDVKALEDMMSIGGVGLLFMLLCCVFGFKLCAEAASLASTLSGSSSSNIGSQIGSAAAGAAKGAAVGALKFGKNAALVAGDAITLENGDSLNETVHKGVEKVGKKVGGAIGKGLGKVGIGKFSDSASGQLNNKGMANNEGAGPKQGHEDSGNQEHSNSTPDNPNTPKPETPKKPAEEAMLDQAIARGGMSKEQEDALLNSAIKASTQREKPSEEAMLDEMIKSGAFSEEQLNNALESGIQQEKERLAEETSATTSSAKNELSDTAAQVAENASNQAAEKADKTFAQRAAASVVSRMDKADRKKAAEERDGKKGDTKKNEEELAVRDAEINRLRHQIEELRETLKASGVDPMSANSVDVDKLFRLEEELKKYGVSID